jgi:phage regulator Rha-like protein
MSELVLLHHNEPMTTSLAIADGTENTHQAIMKMVRTYVGQLQEFGRVGFEIQPFETNGGFQTREIAFLNEPQATLLITFLRNSETVVRFKVALVKAFYELRDRLRGSQQPQFLTSNLSHGADLAVAADRTFRSFMRAGRSAGLALPAALRMANRQTFTRTGMDMLAELGVDPDAMTPAPVANSYLTPVAAFGRAWLAGELPVPACLCHSADLYVAYCRWCVENDHPAAPSHLFHPELRRSGLGIEKTTVRFALGGRPASTVRATIPPGFMDNVRTGEKGMHYAASIARFAQALKDWS